MHFGSETDNLHELSNPIFWKNEKKKKKEKESASYFWLETAKDVMCQVLPLSLAPIFTVSIGVVTSGLYATWVVMIWYFTSLWTLFKPYRDNGRVIINVSVQWSAVQPLSEPKYWGRQAWTNSVDPDQTPRNAASDQGLHCLSLIQQF